MPHQGQPSIGIYHVLGGAYYEVTDPEGSFAAGTTAARAGYRSVTTVLLAKDTGYQEVQVSKPT